MSVSRGVLQSSAILALIQLFQKSLGFVSTLILARLLLPEHFGVVAMVMICLMLFENIADAGNEHYTLQKRELTAEDLHTAWSFDLLLKSGACLLLILLSPLLADYFRMPELQHTLQVASLALPIKALQNPQLLQFARELNYRPVLLLSLIQKLLAFLVTVTLAWLYPSAWPVIIGALVSALVYSGGSYLVCHFKPRWQLQQLSAQWHFSKWIMLRGFIGFCRFQADNILVSRRFDTAALGGYNLLRELSILPAISLIIPCSQPLQAAIARDKTAEGYRLRLSLLLLLLLLLPITLFAMAYPALIVSTLLGSQWISYSGLLVPFACFFLTFCLFDLLSNATLATGRSKLLFWFDLWSTLLVVALLVLIPTAALLEMAWLRALIAILTTLALLLLLQRHCQFGLLRLAVLTLPYLLLALGCWQLTELLIAERPAQPLLELALRISCYFSAYAVTLILLTLALRHRVLECQQLALPLQQGFRWLRQRLEH